MSGLRKALTAAGGLAILVAGCTAAAHLRALQPPAVPRSPLLRVPSSSPARAVGRPVMQRGIDIDLYTYRGQDAAAAARADVAYIKSLHANAVSVSFPFFMHGPRSRGVYASPATPSPAQLAVVAAVAERAGLYVSIRPLLDETNLGRSRVVWRPRDMGAWFASYRRFLLPYAAMAQREHIPEIFIGAEFSQFGSSPRWNTLDRAVRRVFHGTLAYADNGIRIIRAHVGGAGALVTVDAYPRMPWIPPTATAAHLARPWGIYDRLLPPGTVLTEVGIDAVAGAYGTPYKHHWPGARIDPVIQARWFTAACRAAIASKLGGIYFWPLEFGHLGGPTVTYQGAWAHSAGARAISACFAKAAQS